LCEIIKQHYDKKENMTEEENKVIEKFKEIRNIKDFKKREQEKDRLTDFEIATIYKWGLKKDIDEGIEKKDKSSLARTAYLIINEQTEHNAYKKLFKNVSVFEEVQKQVFSHYRSQYLKLSRELDWRIHC
jgi:hypothetical protein